jgi:hypothetical protein
MLRKNAVAVAFLLGVFAVVRPAFAASATASFDSLLAGGYEVKATVIVSEDTAKAIWPDKQAPQLIVTLQKGTTIAVCEIAVSNWLSIVDTSMANVNNCETH